MDKYVELDRLIQGCDNRIAVIMVSSPESLDPVVTLTELLSPQDQRSVYLVAPESVLSMPDCTSPSGPGVATARSGVPGELRIHRLSSDELTIAQGCLCCSFRSELNVFLGQLFMSLLARREPAVKAVIVVTRSPDPALLEQSLSHTPFLAQRFAFCGVLSLPWQI